VHIWRYILAILAFSGKSSHSLVNFAKLGKSPVVKSCKSPDLVDVFNVPAASKSRRVWRATGFAGVNVVDGYTCMDAKQVADEGVVGAA
jgi:hypothetical protein